MRGRIFSGSRDFSPRWISFRPTGCAAKWRSRWRAYSPGGSAPRAVAARRNAHHYQFHRASVAHAARRIRPSGRSAKRLGTRPKKSIAQIFAASSRSARRHADWTALRGRHAGPRRNRARARLWCCGRAAAGVLMYRSFCPRTGWAGPPHCTWGRQDVCFASPEQATPLVQF